MIKACYMIGSKRLAVFEVHCHLIFFRVRLTESLDFALNGVQTRTILSAHRKNLFLGQGINIELRKMIGNDPCLNQLKW